jgi:signal transduction histidine kinase
MAFPPSVQSDKPDPPGRSAGSLRIRQDGADVPAPPPRLFRKYARLFVLSLTAVLLMSSATDLWISYRDHAASLARIQRQQADAAAEMIGDFIQDIQAQLGWTTQLPWPDYPLASQQFDLLRLLRLVPAITEVARLDPSGHEQVRVSRLRESLVGSDIDLSHEAKFVETTARRAYYGPVYFRRGIEPYMTIAAAGSTPDSGVSVAEVDLRFILDLVSQIKAGEHSQVYVVDAVGRLIAHPDQDLVLRNTDLSQLVQVRAARTRDQSLPPAEPLLARNATGEWVLTAGADIQPLGWLVFVELPVNEAYAPLYVSLGIRGTFLLAGLALAMLLGLLLARKMVAPIRILQMGAAWIGAGKLDHRIEIATGDELQGVGDQFNGMAQRLQASYATLEKKVIERTRELELANLAKTRFLAAASHDLRQPLHALGLLVGQLDGDPNRAERRRIVERVGEAIAAMNELFNALLDISKLDAGAVAPDITALPVDTVLRRIETMFGTLARDKSLRLKVLPSRAWIRSDRILLERIILNLVSNAVRYTERGGVLIGCRRRGETWRIEVWDSGVGIAADQRQDIFREFYQITNAGAGPAGLGLGLAIVDRLCRLLGHPLDLASTPGKGSRFSITVPAAPAQIEPAPIRDLLLTAREPFAGKLVLVIDDDSLVLESMGGLLRGWGCQVSPWTSAAAVLAEMFDLHRRPDFIISDRRLMRGENGIELIKRLRGAFGEPIPALLITGDTSPEGKLEAQAAGLELLQKPVPPMALRATLQAMLQSSGTGHALHSVDSPPTQEPAVS